MPPLDSWSTKRPRQAVEGRPGDDAVERPLARQPVARRRPGARDIAEAERLEALPRLLGQRLVAVERDDARRQPRHHGRGVAGAGADLEHAVARLDARARRSPPPAGRRPRSPRRIRSAPCGPTRRPTATGPAGSRAAASPRTRRSSSFGDDALAAQAQQEGGEAFAVVGRSVHASAFVELVRDLVGGQVELQRRHRDRAVAQCRDVGALAHVRRVSRPKRSQ